jgi:hypothetical protein
MDPDDEDYSLFVNDGSGNVTVRILESTGIDLSEYAEGDYLIFKGVINNSETSVRLIPCLQNDIEYVAIDAPTDLAATTSWIEYPLSLEVILTWSHPEGNETDDFLRFIVYRDGEEIGRPTEATYTDIVDVGEYGPFVWEYEVSANYDEGESEPSEPIEVYPEDGISDDLTSGIPTEWSIAAAYPNPFNPTLTTVIGLPETSELSVIVFDIMGREVAVLVKGQLTQGYHTFHFDAGQDHSSGIYFIQAVVPGKMNEIRKVVLMK